MATRSIPPAESESLLAALLENTPAGIIVEDDRRSIIYANQLICDLFGLPVTPEQLVGTDCSESARHVAPLFQEPESFQPRVRYILEKKERVMAEVLPLADGRFFERDYVPTLVQGKYRGHYWVYRDVSEREASRRKLEDLALRDDLTGLLNRRGFLRDAGCLFDLAVRRKAPAALLFADLDGLKQINDTYGHEKGDCTIRMLGEAIRESCRKTDPAARLSGDEFAVFMFDACLEDVRRVKKRIYEHLARASSSSPCPVQASIGGAVLTKPGRMSLEDLLSKADRAMYTVKARHHQNRRNQAGMAESIF